MASEHIDAMAQAFENENPYARRAALILEPPQEDAHIGQTPAMRERAQIFATLAVAYEQRQTRFDIEQRLAGIESQVAGLRR